MKIFNESKNETTPIKYAGTKTILDVKSDVYTFTDQHVRNQVWSGWPPNIDDRTMLALSGISYPEHELTLRKPAAGTQSRFNKIIEIHDSDDEEFEDATESFTVDDEMFEDSVTSKRMESLSELRVSRSAFS